MEKVTLGTFRKYASEIKKAKDKHLTVEKLSRRVGIYPEVISSHLSMFDPMINIDMEYNVRDLLPQIEQYIEEESNKNKEAFKQKEVIKQKELKEYSSIQDFIYKKLTFGGIIDRSATLTDHDLKALSKLIKLELDKRNKKNKKAK